MSRSYLKSGIRFGDDPGRFIPVDWQEPVTEEIRTGKYRKREQKTGVVVGVRSLEEVESDPTLFSSRIWIHVTGSCPATENISVSCSPVKGHGTVKKRQIKSSG
jgi:hypothetical protein